MGQVGLSVGVHCLSLRARYSTVLSEPHNVLFLSHSSLKYTVYYGSSFVSKCAACILVVQYLCVCVLILHEIISQGYIQEHA